MFFVNTMLWTFDPQNYPDSPERPIILRAKQESALHTVIDSIGKRNLIFPKSRRVGVTTMILAVMFWRWCYKRRQSFLLLSAKEDRVDNRGDPSSLFWKLDFMHECLPSWMAPPLDRTKLKFLNPENGSIINGESTNRDADRGGVRTSVMADEVPAMHDSEAVINSISPLTESLFQVGTPQGAFGVFYDTYQELLDRAPERVVLIHWTHIEDFVKGLYWTDEPVLGYSEPSWGGRKPRSIWYDKECLKFPGRLKKIAQEYDIAWHAAGGQYFESELIQRLLGSTVRPPLLRGEIDYSRSPSRWTPTGRGNLLLWIPVDDDGPPEANYGVGCDLSWGTAGEMSSQSALSIVNRDTGEKVAEYKTSRMPPHVFAPLAAAVCRWFHGAKIAWGAQGPGVPFGRCLTEECGYWNIAYREDDETPGAKRGKKIGLSEQGPARTVLFETYQNNLSTGRFVNRSIEAVKELQQFIFGPDGIEHSRAIQASVDPENKGKHHGDIVIADAMANRLLTVRKAIQADKDFDMTTRAPRGSMAERLQEHLQKKRKIAYF